MPRYLAIEWDTREARVVVGSSTGGATTIEQAFAIPLPAKGEAAAAADAQIGEAIQKGLAARRVARGETLLGVGRSSIELKQLSLPPAPDDDLPEMVRFQAMREFHSLGESWPLDFMPLAGAADAPRNVLAATISPEVVEQSRAICRAAHLDPKRLILRPCSAASLLCRARSAELPKVTLLVDMLAEEADLTAILDGQVVYLRTARLPVELAGGGVDLGKTLLAEIRRTMAAVTQAVGDRVQAIYLCGRSDEHAPLVERIAADLAVPVRLFDPFAGLSLSKELTAQPPAGSSRYAPLVGMVIDEAEAKKHAIDFLNPRRRPDPPNRKPLLTLIGAAVAAALLLGAGLMWWSLSTLDSEIAQLSRQSFERDKAVARAREISGRAAEVETWTNSEVVWLDELLYLSNKLPQSQDVMLSDLRLSTRIDGGEMLLEGVTRSTEQINRLEAALRDEFHTIEGGNVGTATGQDNYSWQFTSSVKVASAANVAAAAEAAAAKAALPAAGTPPAASPQAAAPSGQAGPTVTAARPER